MRKLNLFAAVLLVAASAGSAIADRPESPLIKQPAIRRRIEMRRMRFEITPHFLASMNQGYRNAFGPGLTLQFHFLDWLGIGAEGSYLLNNNTALESKVLGTLQPRDTSEYVPPGPQPFRQMHEDRVLSINAAASVYATLTPFSGKFAMFSAAFLKYDLYANLGVGIINYKHGTGKCCADEVAQAVAGVKDPNTDAHDYAGAKVGGMFGFGIHMYFNEWIGLQLEVRDYIVNGNPGGLDVNADRKLDGKDNKVQNNLFFGFGLTFLVPPEPKVTR